VYNINLNYEGVEYIGIQNNAIAYIDSEKPINFLTKKILFTNVKFDEKYTEKIKTSISQKNKVIIDENKIVYISTKGKIKCITMNKSMTCTENNIGHINKLINSPIIEIHRCVSGRNETYAILDLDGNIYYFNSQSNNIGKIMIDGVYLQICLTSGIWGPVLCAVNDKNEVITCELAKYNSERECIGYCEKKEIPPIYKMITSRYQDVLGIDTNGRVHIIYTKTVDSHLLKEKRSFLESLPHVQNIAESGNYLAWIEENGTVGFASRNNELGRLENFNPDESIIDIISVDNTTFAILYSNGSVDYIGSYSEEKDIFKTPLMMILGEVYESTQMAYNGIHLFQYENMGVTKDGYLCTSKGICEVTDVAGETQKIRLFE